MDKNQKLSPRFLYDEEGAAYTSQQITNAYNSGVVDQPDGSFDLGRFSIEEDD